MLLRTSFLNNAISCVQLQSRGQWSATYRQSDCDVNCFFEDFYSCHFGLLWNQR